jgi:hypothetical protein
MSSASGMQGVPRWVEEWMLIAAKAAQWAEQTALLARQVEPHFSATESAEHAKIAAALAQSAGKASGDKANQLRRSAADEAEKAARLAQIVILDLNRSDKAELRDLVPVWSKAQVLANRMATLAANPVPSANAWWHFWR